MFAEARVIRRGRHVGYVECEVKDAEGRLLAKSSSTLMTLRDDRAAGR
jgi:acyl-coenzyme A thioesterase PaaI-like protein